MDFIVQIRLMQAIRNLNDTKTAEKFSITKQTFSKKLKNRTFSIDELQKLADVLGFDMEIIFTDRESGKKV